MTISSPSPPGAGFENSQGARFRKVTLVFLVLAWFGIILRFYSRRVVFNKFGTDDWLMLASAIIYSLEIAATLFMVDYGLGLHVYDLTPQQFVEAFKCWYFVCIFYVSSTASLKLAFGAFFLRVSTERWQFIFLYCLMAVCLAYGIVYEFVVIFQCLPVQHTWTRFMGSSGTCLPESVLLGFTYTHSILYAVVAWIFALLPISLLWKSTMEWRVKLFASLVLSLGAISSISTLVRINYIFRMGNLHDFLYDSLDLGIWSMAEPSVALLAGGLAVSRPLVRHASGVATEIVDRTFRSRPASKANPGCPTSRSKSDDAAPLADVRNSPQELHLEAFEPGKSFESVGIHVQSVPPAAVSRELVG